MSSWVPFSDGGDVAVAFQSVQKDVDEPHADEKEGRQEFEQKRTTYEEERTK